MSGALRSQVDVLRILHKCSPHQRRAILREAPKELIESICECILNTLKGNVPLTTENKKCLRRFKKILRELVNKKIHWRNKRKTLIQKGGALLPFILGPIISTVLGSLLQ